MGQRQGRCNGLLSEGLQAGAEHDTYNRTNGPTRSQLLDLFLHLESS
jgi:hypothetical protein